MKLEKEFKEFNNEIRAEYTDILKEKKIMFINEVKQKFPENLKDNGIDVKQSQLEFFEQGSYAINTTIKTVDSNIDLDLAIVIPLNVYEHEDSRKIKKILSDSISRKDRKIEYKKPCLTVIYYKNGEEDYHIDFPLYAKYNGNYYLAVGKEFGTDYGWEKCEPKKLNNYFKNNFKENPQLRRIVRYLKKWKLEVFKDDNEMPPSIAMTIFACQNYQEKKINGKDDDLRALYHVVNLMEMRLSNVIDPELEILLPVSPYSDTMKKINTNEENRKKFKLKLVSFKTHLLDAINSSDDHIAAKTIVKVLGDEFIIPEKNFKDGENRYERTSQFG